MKLTLLQWLQLRKKIQALQEARAELETFLATTQLDQHSAGNHEEASLLRGLYEELEEDSVRLSAYLVTPQTEWMGGNSRNPRNFRMREPNIVPLPRRYFTEDEVREALDEFPEVGENVGVTTK